MKKNHSRQAIIIFLLMSILQGINAKIDYCTINQNHLLCHRDCDSRVGFSKCFSYKKVIFDDEIKMKNLIVDAHNDVREAATRGFIQNENKDRLPAGKDMKYLKWDNLLYCSAKAKADLCGTEETAKELRVINGTAIGEVTFSVMMETRDIKKNNNYMWLQIIIGEIYAKEVLNFPVSSIQKFARTGIDGQSSVANFGQIISNKIYLVGCATSSYKPNNGKKRALLFVCHYGPVGLEEGSIVYEEKKDKFCEDEPAAKLCKRGDNYSEDLYPMEPQRTTPPTNGPENSSPPTNGPENSSPPTNGPENSSPSTSGPEYSSQSPSDPGSSSVPKIKGTGFLFVGVLLKALFAISKI